MAADNHTQGAGYPSIIDIVSGWGVAIVLLTVMFAVADLVIAL